MVCEGAEIVSRMCRVFKRVVVMDAEATAHGLQLGKADRLQGWKCAQK